MTVLSSRNKGIYFFTFFTLGSCMKWPDLQTNQTTLDCCAALLVSGDDSPGQSTKDYSTTQLLFFFTRHLPSKRLYSPWSCLGFYIDTIIGIWLGRKWILWAVESNFNYPTSFHLTVYFNSGGDQGLGINLNQRSTNFLEYTYCTRPVDTIFTCLAKT